MSFFAITFPSIDPVLVEIGPIAIRWYALAYIAGLFLGVWHMKRLTHTEIIKKAHVDDFFIWAFIGILVGGRLGYVLFYKPVFYLQNPSQILMTWQGGMSFHGGLIGVVTAIVLFAHYRKINMWSLADIVGCSVPIGLGLGRLANFVNGELYGRISPDTPWAMVFPGGGPEPRHPSQLYQAALEGFLLFIVLNVLWQRYSVRNRPGLLCGVFCIGYGLMRIVGELFRQPDSHLGYLVAGTTIGQWLSLPMVCFGIYAIWRAGPIDSRDPAKP